jgi:A/G-specific adenine glycosylase
LNAVSEAVLLVDDIEWFQQTIVQWYEWAGRKNLPWQKKPNAYRVWLSEIMLQQTQVSTVIPYFERFTTQFPDLASLAAANVDDVLALWSGLGYYARARNLHKTAQMIARDYQGEFPRDFETLISLPGIGRSTAGAILSLAMKQTAPILDGNVKRVLMRFYALEGWSGTSVVEKKLWTLSTALTPDKNCRQYNQAMMDIGATLCTRSQAKCTQCPLQSRCLAFAQQRVNELPQPKPRKSLPLRCCQLLVISNQNNEFFMEKRPTKGLWGGLWSLPQIPSDAVAEEICLQQWHFLVRHVETLPVFRHSFSHFHLDIRPVILVLTRNETTIAENNQYRWVKLAQLTQLGLAAPVSKILLQQLNTEQASTV